MPGSISPVDGGHGVDKTEEQRDAPESLLPKELPLRDVPGLPIAIVETSPFEVLEALIETSSQEEQIGSYIDQILNDKKNVEKRLEFLQKILLITAAPTAFAVDSTAAPTALSMHRISEELSSGVYTNFAIVKAAVKIPGVLVKGAELILTAKLIRVAEKKLQEAVEAGDSETIQKLSNLLQEWKNERKSQTETYLLETSAAATHATRVSTSIVLARVTLAASATQALAISTLAVTGVSLALAVAIAARSTHVAVQNEQLVEKHRTQSKKRLRALYDKRQTDTPGVNDAHKQLIDAVNKKRKLERSFLRIKKRQKVAHLTASSLVLAIVITFKILAFVGVLTLGMALFLTPLAALSVIGIGIALFGLAYLHYKKPSVFKETMQLVQLRLALLTIPTLLTELQLKAKERKVSARILQIEQQISQTSDSKIKGKLHDEKQRIKTKLSESVEKLTRKKEKAEVLKERLYRAQLKDLERMLGKEGIDWNGLVERVIEDREFLSALLPEGAFEEKEAVVKQLKELLASDTEQLLQVAKREHRRTYELAGS